MTALTLGDVVTCTGCGAQATAYTTDRSGRWKPGDAVVLTWSNGPRARHTATKKAPDLCLWCDDRRIGFPSIIDRPLPGEPVELVSGPLATFELPPVEPARAQGGLQRSRAYEIGRALAAAPAEVQATYDPGGRGALADMARLEDAIAAAHVSAVTPRDDSGRGQSPTAAFLDTLGAGAHAANVREALRPPEPFRASLVPDSLADAAPTICYAPGCFSVATVGNRCAPCAARADMAAARGTKKPKKAPTGQGSLFAWIVLALALALGSPARADTAWDACDHTSDAHCANNWRWKWYGPDRFRRAERSEPRASGLVSGPRKKPTTKSRQAPSGVACPRERADVRRARGRLTR